jgi:predicted transcriptional regulator of viral defense system
MRATEALAELQALGRPVIETGEVVARLGITSANAGMLLHRLESAGQIQRIARGLWLMDKSADRAVVVPYLTRPFPAYVSLWSALSRYGMIEQIPKQVFVISLGRPSTIETPLGVYSIHHVVPEVFGGYSGDDRAGFVATPEKALFDSVYLPSAQRRNAHLPELELPSDLDRAAMGYWTSRIHAPWLRAKVAQTLERILDGAAVGASF